MGTSQISRGERLKRLRERAGFSQAALAQHIGIDPMTVSRMERDVPKSYRADVVARMATAFGMDSGKLIAELGISAESLDHSALRGTGVGESTKPYGPNANGLESRKAIESFVREMIRSGADDAEVDWIEETFRRPETARLAMHDSEGNLLTPKQVDEQYDALIEGMRHIITRRIERRRKASKAK